MRRLVLASLSVLLLSGCMGLTKRVPPSFQPPPPPPPAAILLPCVPTPRSVNSDGSMASAQVERNLGQGDVDLAQCEAKRRLAVDAWPR